MSNRELKPAAPGLVTKKSKELVNLSFFKVIFSPSQQGEVSVAPTKSGPNIVSASLPSGGTGNVSVKYLDSCSL